MSMWTNIKLGDAINFNPAERITSGAIAKKISSLRDWFLPTGYGW